MPDPEERTTGLAANLAFALVAAIIAFLNVTLVVEAWRDRASQVLPGVGMALGLGLALGHVFFLFSLSVSGRRRGPGFISLCFVGYAALFGVSFVLVQAPLLFLVFLLIYSALLHRPVLSGYLFLFVVSFLVLPPYSLPIFIVSALAYTAVTQLAQTSRNGFLVVCFLLGTVLLVVVLLPVLHLCTQSTAQTLLYTLKGGPSDVGSESWEVRQALKMSLLTATLTTALVTVLGVPLGYAMVRGSFKGKGLIDSLIDIPILVPPLVAGMALLLLLGPDSPIGVLMRQRLGVRIDGSLIGIVAAQIFVSSPFLVRSAMTAFDGIDPRLERVARTLGASPMRVFFLITLPLALKGILRGSVLTWARAVSEFGSLMVIAYRPFTAPTLIYNRFSERGVSESSPIAVLLVLMCFWVVIAARFVRFRPHAANPR